VVIVATIRALKHHGGAKKDELKNEDEQALEKGMVNLDKQIENIRKYGLEPIVAINRFATDSDHELATLKKAMEDKNVEVSLTEVFEKGGEGGVDLAEKVVKVCEAKNNFKVLYDEKKPIKEKIETIVKEIYGGSSVAYSASAEKTILEIEKWGLSDKPICMAKTQYSLSDNPKLLGAPSGFEVKINEVKLSNGAGFIVCLTGDIMTMPGLPKVPAANHMDIDEEGNIFGLF
ncbi:MAG: formate--tetrahydrofolate ligase, partial [Clostridium sp.]|nr:formate--tetrahydrofolate ligase [Clostridium sp.]